MRKPDSAIMEMMILGGLSPAYLEAIGYFLNELKMVKKSLDEIANQTWEIATQDHRDNIYTTMRGWCDFLLWTIEKLESLGRPDLADIFRKGLCRTGTSRYIREYEEEILSEYLMMKETGRWPK